MFASLLLIAPLLIQPPLNPTDDACTLRATYGTPILLGDITEQKIAVTASGDCTSFSASINPLLVNSSDSRHRAFGHFKPGTPTILELSNAILPPTEDGSVSNTWHVYGSESDMIGGKKPVAQLFITASVVTVKTSTDVVYGGNDADVLNAIWASGVKTEHVAYYAPSAASASVKVKNRAMLDLPDLGPVKQWSITADSATLLTADGARCDSECTPKSISFIDYEVDVTSSGPIVANATATRDNAQEGFVLRVELAESVQSSSLPLDIADIAYVLCQKHVSIDTWDVIRHNKLAAVTNAAVTNGACWLVVSEEDIMWAIARQHGIAASRHTCADSYAGQTAEHSVQGKRTSTLSSDPTIGELGEARCKEVGSRKGEEVTVFYDSTGASTSKGLRERVESLRQLYGRQRVTMYVYADKADRDGSAHTFLIDATLKGRREIAIDFGDRAPSPDAPYTIEVTAEPDTRAEPAVSSIEQFPARIYRSRLRPKGPFGITHRAGSLGSRSVRIFATVPVSFGSVRFPAAGLDLESSSDSQIAQLTTLSTGLLLTFEPWDYTRGTNMYSVPFRIQTGLLLSNWYKGVFHPSTFVGLAITLPLFHGTKQADTDLALGAGWEVDLRSGYDGFGPRNHLLVTLGLNVLSLFGPQSAPRSK